MYIHGGHERFTCQVCSSFQFSFCTVVGFSQRKKTSFISHKINDRAVLLHHMAHNVVHVTCTLLCLDHVDTYTGVNCVKILIHAFECQYLVMPSTDLHSCSLNQLQLKSCIETCSLALIAECSFGPRGSGQCGSCQRNQLLKHTSIISKDG